MKINRNDPCPCGSGKKYKKCCLNTEESISFPPDIKEGLTDLNQMLDGQNFDSLEELNSFLSDRMDQRNQSALADFDGLSPEQMRHFIYSPFESNELAVVASSLGDDPDAPILRLFRLLADAIGEKGLKPTATGNLPRNFCREAALAYWGEELHRENTRHGNINMEENFFEMHVTRVVAELAGLIRKYRGKFILSRNCRKIIAEQGYSGIYLQLFQNYSRQFNWAYRDGYPELGIIQNSFLYTLWLLQRYGQQWLPHTFYTDKFLQAFPSVLDEIEPSPYEDPEKTLHSCYTLRILENYLKFLGLAELHQTSEGIISRQYNVKKLPLLDAVISFHV